MSSPVKSIWLIASIGFLATQGCAAAPTEALDEKRAAVSSTNDGSSANDAPEGESCESKYQKCLDEALEQFFSDWEYCSGSYEGWDTADYVMCEDTAYALFTMARTACEDDKLECEKTESCEPPREWDNNLRQCVLTADEGEEPICPDNQPTCD